MKSCLAAARKLADEFGWIRHRCFMAAAKISVLVGRNVEMVDLRAAADEDLHWADVASVDLLAYVAKTMRDSALLTVARTRPLTQEGEHVPRQVAELSRGPVGEVLLLGPLNRAAVERQAAGILGRAPDDQTILMLHHLGDRLAELRPGARLGAA